MKLCEHLNNLLSLYTFNNLVKTERGIYHVKFNKDKIYSTSQDIFYNDPSHSYFVFKVKKLLFVPLHKIIGFDSKYDIIEEYRVKSGGIIPMELVIETLYSNKSGIELVEAIVIGNPTNVKLKFGGD